VKSYLIRAAAVARTETVLTQTAKREGNKKGMIGMLLPSAVTKNANIKVEVTHAKQRQRCRKEPHLMLVIVLLILSASAIATPSLGPNMLRPRLRNKGVTKKGMIGMLLPSAVTKMQNIKVGGNACKTGSTTLKRSLT
jgi:hypothetical protein